MADKLKIANVVRRFTFAEWGGTETVVWNTARELQKNGHHPEILATRALCSTPEETVDGIAIRRFPYFYPYWPLTAARRLALDKKGGNPFSRGLWQALHRTDATLVHCHTMARLGETVRNACGSRNIPYVVSFHGGCFDVPPQELAAMRKPTRGCFHYGRLLDLLLGRNRFLNAAAGIICVGYNEYEMTCDRYPDRPVVYLPNGVEVERFEKVPEVDFRRQWQIDPAAQLILCVSRIDYQKNQQMLLQLLERLKEKSENIHLVLIGPVTAPDYYAEMQSFIAARQLQQLLTVIPGLPPDSPELAAAYHAADLFILPSIHEPFGIVVLEAWAAGVPVIAASTGGLKKLIEPEKTGLLFDHDSLADLEFCYQRMIEEPSLRENLIAHAGHTVRQEYSWPIITRKLLDFYDLVLSQSGRKGQKS